MILINSYFIIKLIDVLNQGMQMTIIYIVFTHIQHSDLV